MKIPRNRSWLKALALAWLVSCSGCLREFEDLLGKNDDIELTRVPESDDPEIVTEQPDENIPVQFVGPAEAAEIASPVKLVVLGDVSEVVVEVDGTTVARLDSPPFEWTVDPNVLSDGNHSVKLSTEYGGTAVSHTFIFIIVNPAVGGVDPDAVRATILAMAKNTWYEIPDTRLESVGPNPEPDGSLKGVIAAWSGGAYDTKRDRLIVWGGGHMDYAGNELYAFDLKTFQWRRLTEPSALWPGDPANREGRAKTPDGRPMSRHTYDFLEYIPEPTDRFFVGGGSVYGGSPRRDPNTWLFDFDDLKWSAVVDCPVSGSGAISGVDSKGRVWQHGSYYRDSKLSMFDPATNKWTDHEKDGAGFGHGWVGVVDQKRDILIAIRRGMLRAWDLNKEFVTSEDISTKGDTDIEDEVRPGMDYHPGIDRIVAWHSGSSVYELNTETWTWKRIQTRGHGPTVPPSAAHTGTMGRWRYVSSLNAFVVVNSVSRNVFIYKH